MTVERFIALWTHPQYPPLPVDAQELAAAERRLGLTFPAQYREAVLAFGLPRPTIALLDAIDDRGLDVRDVADFLDPAAIVEMTEAWREMGLPDEAVAFATDCMGNLFCFVDDPALPGQAAASILFFNHDDREVDLVAPSFDRWIDEFCGLAAN
jgi:cell wall assembly regulator SMI1